MQLYRVWSVLFGGLGFGFFFLQACSYYFPLSRVFQFLTSFNGQQQLSNKKSWTWRSYIAQKPKNEVLVLLRTEFDRSEGQGLLQHLKPFLQDYTVFSAVKEDRHTSLGLEARAVNTGKSTGSPCSPALRRRKQSCHWGQEWVGGEWKQTLGASKKHLYFLSEVWQSPPGEISISTQANRNRWSWGTSFPAPLGMATPPDSPSQQEMPSSAALPWSQKIHPAGMQHMC